MNDAHGRTSAEHIADLRKRVTAIYWGVKKCWAQIFR